MSSPTCSIQVNPRTYKSEVITYCLPSTQEYDGLIPWLDQARMISNVFERVALYRIEDSDDKEVKDPDKLTITSNVQFTF